MILPRASICGVRPELIVRLRRQLSLLCQLLLLLIGVLGHNLPLHLFWCHLRLRTVAEDHLLPWHRRECGALDADSAPLCILDVAHILSHDTILAGLMATLVILLLCVNLCLLAPPHCVSRLKLSSHGGERRLNSYPIRRSRGIYLTYLRERRVFQWSINSLCCEVGG